MADSASIGDSLRGKRVVSREGTSLGTVSRVRNETIYVRLDADVSRKFLAKLGWDGGSDEDYPIPADAVRRVTDGSLHLHGL